EKDGLGSPPLLVVAAGNDRSWVGTPADAPGVLTVGGIDKNGNISSFSSYGITIDQRVKPDVLALATGDALVSLSGAYGSGNGTSFASPVMCGLATCLWQAYPKLSNKDIISVIRQSGNRYIAPLMPFGYGVADMQKAMQLAKALSESK
ncbi:MAG TPA: S8 family serine peptidase, partial [Niabella sp.]|nr:S8 family serine peptidase [Niabella sp.]